MVKGPYILLTGSQAEINIGSINNGTYKVVCGGGEWDNEIYWKVQELSSTGDVLADTGWYQATTIISENEEASIIIDNTLNENLKVTYEEVSIDEPDEDITIYLAFHIISEYEPTSSEKTKYDNAIKVQMDKIKYLCSTTMESMLWDPNKNDEDQARWATKGGKNFKINFEYYKKSPMAFNTDWHTHKLNWKSINSTKHNWKQSFLDGSYQIIEEDWGVAAKFGVDNNLARGDPCQTINIFFGPSSSNDSIGFAYLPFFGTYGAYKWSQWNYIECLHIVGKWSNYNLGLVCVHEIGHNLGLLHTWEESALPWTIGILDTSYHTEPNFGGFDWVT